MAAIVTITEEGVITFHGVNMRNRLALAQHCINLYEELMAQGQPPQPQYPADFTPRQPEPNGVEPEPEATA